MSASNCSMSPSVPGPGRPARTMSYRSPGRDERAGDEQYLAFVWQSCIHRGTGSPHLQVSDRHRAVLILHGISVQKLKASKGTQPRPSPHCIPQGPAGCEEINCSLSHHSSFRSVAHTRVHTTCLGAESTSSHRHGEQAPGSTVRLRLQSKVYFLLCYSVHPPGTRGKGSLRGPTQASCRGDTSKGCTQRAPPPSSCMQTAREAMMLATAAMALL